MISLYSVLRKLAPAFESHKIDRKKIMAKVFPKAAFDDKSYNYNMNYLLRLSENHMSLKEIRNTDFVEDYHLLSVYIQKDISKNYNFIYQRIHSKLNKIEKRDVDYYHKKFMMAQISNDFHKKKNIRDKDNSLQEVANSFDIYYFSNKLRYSCHMLSNKTIISDHYQNDFINDIIQFLKTNQQNYTQPAIQIYLCPYSLLSNETENYFIEIKSLLKNIVPNLKIAN